MLDKKKLALIHIVKKELGLKDTEYRSILKEITGVETAKDLDEEKFKKLMNYFVRSKYYQVNPLGLTIKQKLYIDYMAKELGWDKTHLLNFIKKYYHRSNILELSKFEAMKLIESLKNIKKRL
ncbi:MAG: regulatory protein GemA [Candidatus Omnitrophica bacterium]|nr:regulatory protein GemA [Candidatus Omnitrophota bacterium]MCM8800369.1 regulatory protein GemA [Candidatus Omnitrophota bacterium]